MFALRSEQMHFPYEFNDMLSVFKFTKLLSFSAASKPLFFSVCKLYKPQCCLTCQILAILRRTLTSDAAQVRRLLTRPTGLHIIACFLHVAGCCGSRNG